MNRLVCLIGMLALAACSPGPDAAFEYHRCERAADCRPSQQCSILNATTNACLTYCGSDAECLAGATCALVGDGIGLCRHACRTDAASGCPSGMTCVPLGLVEGAAGQCVAR